MTNSFIIRVVISRRTVVAKARQTMGGLMLEAVTPFGDEDRRRCRELNEVMAEAEARRRRPFTESRSWDEAGAGDPPGHEDRLRAYEVSLPAADPGVEPVHCWGGCGRTLKNGSQLRSRGWVSREVRCSTGREVESHCPECFERWGFIEPYRGT